MEILLFRYNSHIQSYRSATILTNETGGATWMPRSTDVLKNNVKEGSVKLDDIDDQLILALSWRSAVSFEHIAFS